jgi:hypothetical protein
MKGSIYFFFLALLIITAQSCSNPEFTESIGENNMVGHETLLHEFRSAQTDRGNKKVKFPSEDPGAPLYARTGEILNQFFVTDGWLVIPFYRTPECIREDFNLLTIFDVPAAFGCPLTVEGFYMIEKGAPQGTFPIIVQSNGSAVPVWMVRWDDFLATTADGILTIEELRSLNPLMGTANKFHETLRPRMENHLVQINASGYLTDGRSFRFHVTHKGSETSSIGLTFY